MKIKSLKTRFPANELFNIIVNCNDLRKLTDKAVINIVKQCISNNLT